MRWKGSKEIGIQYHAGHRPNKPAIISDEGALTFRELHIRANRLANALVDLGIKPHDTLAMLLPNSARSLEIFTAAGRIGAVPVALNCHFKGEEISYIVNQSEARILIFAEEFLPVILPIQDRLPRVEHFVVVGLRGPKPPVDPLWDLEDLMARSPETEPRSGPPDGVSASLIYTSGTTGRPKGCYKTSRRRLETLLFYADLYGFRSEDVHLMVCPFYHSAPNAFAIMALVLGNTLVILRRFDPVETLKAIHQYQVTTTFMVPTQINRILHLPHDLLERWKPSSLRILIVAAAPFPFPLKRKAVEYFGDGKLYEFYGATEQSMNTLLYPHEQLERPGSCGRAIPGNEILLLDKEGNPVPPGEVGELFVKNDYLMDCYYNMPEETAKVFRNGYCSVGDLARVDEDGYYYIVDRKVDMVISGGVNIYPVEIEECLFRHPKIFDAAVIGVEDPLWGERLVAYIVLQSGAKMTEQEVQDHVVRHLADYKKPKEVYFVHELPYSGQGKLLKRELKALYPRQASGSGTKRGATNT
jgi:acyl-CoA synthetase (AMP-forming)/AMP-acid ligase II